ncbi:MAG: cytochrome d ubiquinol oxidase subunit II [Anaerolineae bacterium]|nr:cytochrome d ubiquinol oxidase subunit II [Anaerolineae bacterium]
MDLNILWFILIGVLYIGYFVLEGFDYGVGILLPFLGKSDIQRRVIINTVGPHWDGNEVWLLTAGGATFAAFSGWYATLFSGFYLPLFLILIALIFRGVAFEFRSKDDNPLWRSLWDWAICVGSFIPALLWGVAFANFVLGVPINEAHNYVGGFWNLLNPYALLGGLISLGGFIVQGAIFLTLKTTGDLVEGARAVTRRIFPFVLLAMVVFVILSAVMVNFSVLAVILAVVTVLVYAAGGWMLRSNRDGWGFILNSAAILLATVTIFVQLFPRVLISSLNPDWSLTIYNSSSSPYTLQVMSIIALIFVPIVLAYQIWTYWLFKRRVTEKIKLEY